MHQEDELSPEEFRAFKSSQDRGTPLTESEYEEQLARIKATLLQCLIDYGDEYLDALGCSSDIVGVLVYGSWANKNPHSKSDIDMFLLCTGDIGQAWEEFQAYLKQSGLPRVSVIGSCDITDAASVSYVFKSYASPFKDASYFVVSPGELDLDAIIHAQ